MVTGSPVQYINDEGRVFAAIVTDDYGLKSDKRELMTFSLLSTPVSETSVAMYNVEAGTTSNCWQPLPKAKGDGDEDIGS